MGLFYSRRSPAKRDLFCGTEKIAPVKFSLVKKNSKPKSSYDLNARGLKVSL